MCYVCNHCYDLVERCPWCGFEGAREHGVSLCPKCGKPLPGPPGPPRGGGKASAGSH